MIVQCVNCETRFQLDESRVPLAGVRVRCSRCKESFFLAHPSASEAEAINEVVEQAVHEDRLPAPDAARDLDSGGELSFASAVPTPEHEALPHQAPASPPTADAGPVLAGLGDDDDWQFSDEIPEQEPFADAELIPGSDFASPVGLEGSGAAEPLSDAAAPGLAEQGFLEPALSGEEFPRDQFEGDATDEMPFLDDRVVEAPLIEEPVAATPLVDPGSSSSLAADDAGAVFGSVEDFSSLIEEVTTGAQPAGLDLASAPQATGGSAFGDPSDMSIGSPAPRTSEAAAVEQLGDPEDWNFFSETPASEYQRPATASMPSLESRAAALEDLAADEDALRDPAAAGASWEARNAIARAGHGLGWFATLSLVAVALAQGFFLEEVKARAPLGSLTVGSAVVDRLVPSWIDNQYEPRMLAVRGRLSNPTGQVVAHGQTLLVALLDGAGNPLAAPPALAAISLSEESIRELPIDQLRMAQARGARALARSTLAPGEEIGFTALFDAVPPGAVSLQLQTGPVWEVPDPRVTTPAPDASPMSDQAEGAETTEPENGLLE